MGRDKARHRLGSKTLLAIIDLEARRLGLPVRIIRRDLVRRCGPLGGIYTALKTSEAAAELFLACDMPFVSTDLLTSVLETWKTDDDKPTPLRLLMGYVEGTDPPGHKYGPDSPEVNDRFKKLDALVTNTSCR